MKDRKSRGLNSVQGRGERKLETFLNDSNLNDHHKSREVNFF